MLGIARRCTILLQRSAMILSVKHVLKTAPGNMLRGPHRIGSFRVTHIVESTRVLALPS